MDSDLPGRGAREARVTTLAPSVSRQSPSSTSPGPGHRAAPAARIVHTINHGRRRAGAAGAARPASWTRALAPRVHQAARGVRIDAPLSGPRWAAIIGAHRRSLQPVNGRFTNGQRFAVDWNRVRRGGSTCVRRPVELREQPELRRSLCSRSATAGWWRRVDGIPDQPPDSFTPVGLEIADGNYVILRLAARASTSATRISSREASGSNVATR